jgi:hypothetical protein
LNIFEAGLQPDRENANEGTQRGRGLLEKSLRQLGAGRSILTDKDGNVIAGNKTLESAADIDLPVRIVETDGNELVVVKRTDLDLYSETDKRARQLAYADNKIAEVDLAWKPEQIAVDFEPLELKEWGFDNQVGGEDEQPHQTLSDRFIVPPFSVLNARGGIWQDRKRAWLALGIQSEIGRGGGGGTPPHPPTVTKNPDGTLNYNGTSGQSQRFDNQRYDKTFRGDGIGRAVVYGTEGNVSEQSGTSIFDPVLCELAYRWFIRQNGKILDPFAGGSVRGVVASKLGYEYTGIDLRPEQIAANEQQAKDITPDKLPIWITGDSQNVKELAPGEYDFIFSCPPYFDLELYSDDKADLSNAGNYDDFIKVYRDIIAGCVSMLKDNCFACFVVGDIRDKKGFYRNFPADTIQAFEDAGMTLYNEAILVTAVGSLPIRVGRQFQSGRKLGKTHQNVLVFYKGDPKEIKEFGDVQCGDVEELQGANEISY